MQQAPLGNSADTTHAAARGCTVNARTLKTTEARAGPAKATVLGSKSFVRLHYGK